MLTGCNKKNTKTYVVDVASSVNFRCEVNTIEESYIIDENPAELFEQCYGFKKKAIKIKDSAPISENHIRLHFVGDCVDNAPVKDGKADYGMFVIFSNDTVRFEYDTSSEYYTFEDGFYNFINTLLLFCE